MRIDADSWQWLVEAILHLSHQIRRVEQKVDLLLSQQDFSKEDSAVLALGKTVEEAMGRVEEAKGRIPPRVPPVQTK